MKKYFHIKHIAFVAFTMLLTLGYSQTNSTLTGKVIENPSGEPVPFASVKLRSISNDSVVGGTLTDFDGVFHIETTINELYIEVIASGYSTYKSEGIAITENPTNLADIVLSKEMLDIEEVEVIGEVSTTTFKLDKRVFNVGKDLSTSGASALEVLNNVPSVNVGIEGEVTLRGNGGVQILIDGKPSVLADDESGALGSITADMISQVEVITNPSAKYDAEGSTGIINIIMKKEEKKGSNGSVSVNTGLPNNHSIGFSFNHRSEKFNIFTQAGAGYRTMPRTSLYSNENLLTGELLESEGSSYRNELFYNLTLGTDYHISKNDVLTLSGNVSYESEDSPSTTNFLSYDSNGNIVDEWIRTEETEGINPKYQYDLKYQHDFKSHKDHDLGISITGNFFKKDQSSVFSNDVLIGNTERENQRTSTLFFENRNTFKIDYTRPMKNGFSLEAGGQYLLNSVSNSYEVANEDAGVYVIDENFTNTFDYNQNVLGLYSAGSYEKDKWGAKVGLRAEHTDLSTYLVNTQERNDRQFWNLFPSLHTSYKISKRISFQAGYSRRIYRPRLWDLNPFFNITNNFNIRTGNPNLLPEFTDSYEFGSIFILNKITLNANVYHRYTDQVIEQISTVENGVTTYSPENLGTRNTTGAELNFRYTPTKALSFHGDVNYNYFSRKGVFEDQDFNFNGQRWSSKLTGKLKVSKKLDIQLSGNYQSRVKTVQGYTSGTIFSDFGIRYKILKGKAVLNANVRDIFASRLRENFTYGDDFIVSNFDQRGRFFTVGFSYAFGKGEAMEYGGHGGPGPRR